ncbi:MAG: hypothetical protein LBU53_04265 [Zoogloeaceae bacterium]|jgi:hypothetical protein|nr:hypothetical protein [Zoogloeaceae bacterium]
MKTIFVSFFLALIFPGQYIWAEEQYACDERIVNTVGEHFELDHFFTREGFNDDGKLIGAGMCKPFPQNRQWVIAAFGYDTGNEDDVYGLPEKYLLLSVVDISKNRVIASYQRSILEDGTTDFSVGSIRLDTGRYNLSSTTRAFGVRLFTFQGSKAMDGGMENDLTLFIMEGSALKPVLSQTMRYWSYGVDRTHGINYDDMLETKIVISVEPTSTKGFADLRFIARRSDHKSVSAVVKYNGESYDMTPFRNVFVDWWSLRD